MSANSLKLEWSKRLMMYNDFDDDALDVGATRFSNGHASSLSTSQVS